MYSWSSPAFKTRPPIVNAEMPWWRWRLFDGRGLPPWLSPAPSMRFLVRPYADPCPPRVRYGPDVASKLTATPARHHGYLPDR